MYRFKLSWTAENFVLPAGSDKGAWTMTGGETWVKAATEDDAIRDFRRLLNAKCEIKVIA